MQKNALPSKESRRNASRAVGRSVSRPATPNDLWWVRWYGYRQKKVLARNIPNTLWPDGEKLTLKEALYGIPIGRLANMASRRFANAERKARLWEISWMARKRFWLAVAPIAYAVRRNFHENTGVSRSRYAHAIWRETTARTTYLVRGSGPHNLVTYCMVRGEQTSNNVFSFSVYWQMPASQRRSTCIPLGELW